MGIFSGKEIVNVSSNVSRMITDVPKSNNSAITQAILSGTPILDGTLRKYVSSMKGRLEALNTYAKSSAYVHGLPTIETNFSSNGFPEKFYESDFSVVPNKPVGNEWNKHAVLPISYTYVGKVETHLQREANKELMMYYHVVYQMNYLISSGELVGFGYNGYQLSTRNCYNDEYLTFSIAQHLTIPFGSPSGTAPSWDGFTYEATVYLNSVLINTSTPILIFDYYAFYNLYARQAHFFIGAIIYSRQVNGAVEYRTVDPVPILIIDIPLNSPNYATKGRFPVDLYSAIAEMTYPILPIRYNGTYSDDVSVDGKSVTTALKKISLNKSEIISALESNPNSNLIDDAYITFGFTPNTITDDDEYLAVATILQQLKNYSTTYTNELNNIIKFTEGEFTYQLEFKRIDKFEVAGTGYSKNYWTDGLVPIGEPFYELQIVGDGWDYVQTYHKYERNYYEIRIPKDDNTQTVYQLIGATGFYTVNTDLSTRYSTVKPNNDNFFLPLFENTLDFIPRVKHDRIISYSIVLITNSIQYDKLAWYQGSIFKFLIIIVAAVLTVINPATTTIISTILAGGTPALYLLAKIVGAFIVSGLAVEYLIDKLGKLGVVLAVVLAIATAYVSNQLQTTLDKAFKVLTSTIDSYSVYQKNLLGDIIKLNETFTEEYDKRKEELDELTSYADTGVGIDWLRVSSVTTPSQLVFTETPTEFYTRTSTVINLPELSYSSVNDYYSVNLQLPKGDIHVRNE